jgi:hypothetical protein
MNPDELNTWKNLYRKNKDHIMNFDIPSENNLIKKYCGQSSLETAENRKNG